ncbi:hypothetical protein HY041_01195 [Candidatus Roizmanbacteria bacterium]|nr:hypothetical protein [Candidatus Roizmanbacteria bacterium]
MPIDLVKEDDNYWNISVNYLYLLKDLLSSEDNPTMLNLLSSFATGDIQRVISTIKSIQVKFGKTPRRLVSSGEELLAHFLAILEKDLKSSQLHPGFSTKNFPNIWLGSTNFSRH